SSRPATASQIERSLEPPVCIGVSWVLRCRDRPAAAAAARRTFAEIFSANHAMVVLAAHQATLIWPRPAVLHRPGKRGLRIRPCLGRKVLPRWGGSRSSVPPARHRKDVGVVGAVTLPCQVLGGLET